MTDTTITGYTIEGPAGTHSGRSRSADDIETIAHEALAAVTGTTWKQISPAPALIFANLRGSVWEVEGINNPDDRSGPYRLTIGTPTDTTEERRS